jgi:hypothetical protein
VTLETRAAAPKIENAAHGILERGRMIDKCIANGPNEATNIVIFVQVRRRGRRMSYPSGPDRWDTTVGRSPVGEMRLARRLGVEAARPKHLGRGLAPGSPYPKCHSPRRPVQSGYRDGGARRFECGDADLERVGPRAFGLPEDRRLHAAQPGRSGARAPGGNASISVT